MDIYSLVLFLHIVGALGFFVALGLEWTGLQQLQGAMLPEQVRAWMKVLKGTNKVAFPSMLTTVITGIYLVLKEWGWIPWILVTLGSLVLVIALSVVLTRPRMAAIGRTLAGAKGTVSQNIHLPMNQPALWISVQIRVAIALGIVFLKIAKPDLLGSLLTMGVAIVIGYISALPMARPGQVQTGPAD